MRFAFHRCLAAAGVVLLAGCSQPAAAPPPAPPVQKESPVERGKHLVTVSGCHDCHTPVKMGPNGPELDMSKMLSGHPENVKVGKAPKGDATWIGFVNSTGTAWAGPWGLSYTANLTPDPSGLAVWTEDLFVRAIRDGKHMGTSRPILPPMPWTAFRNYSDEDLKAIFAYLKTIPPVSNHVPDPEIAGPPPPATK